jgi:hypothetical protein
MKANETTGKTLRQRFDSLGLTTDSVTAKIEGVTRSKGEKGTWFIMVAMILIDNIFHPFVCKLNAGAANDEYIKQCEEFFNSFKAGDYVLTNLQLRVKGETWEDDEGNKGVYESNYISIPFISDMLYLGSDTVYKTKEQEAKYAKMQLSNLKLVED